jgi:hypothetical protein
MILPRMGLLITAMALSTAPAFADDWFFAHSGQETCVPIDDIDSATGQRLYYHTGDMHSPREVEQMFVRLGNRIEEQPAPIPDVTFAFKATGYGRSTFIVLFKDEAVCKAAMSKLHP